MSLDTLKTAKKVIGVKQATKAVAKGLAHKVFIAADADKRVTQPLMELCSQQGVAVMVVPTMVELGQACSIEVGAAAAAVVR